MEAHGTLSVRVYTSLAQIPVQGATVAVSQRLNGGKHTLLAVRTTDKSGVAPSIEIAAPSPALSNSPGHAPGYTLCDIRVQHPEFQLVMVEGVQIFPGIETVQDIMLLPLPEHAIPRNQMRQIEITPQPL